MRVYYTLYNQLLSTEALKAAFRQVKSAKGAAGIDGQSVYDFAQQEDVNVAQLVHELRTKSYQPQPNRRVLIPKEGGGERALGIPCVRDRVVQQALLNVLQPIFEPHFHPSSYAYRPGRGCHQAIAKATRFIREYELDWVVDMDLSKCFDTLNHQVILTAFRRRIADSSVLRLLRLFLESGVMIDGSWQASTLGSPQGGVISPLIANVYLDAFDQEMKKRGHRIVRYADDILIFKKSRSAAHNALAQATQLLESGLSLTVNREKTRVLAASDGIPYLGVVIGPRTTRIQEKKITGFRLRVKAATRRTSPVNLLKVISDINPMLRGFANYFRIANCKGAIRELMGWIRRRLRAKQLALWKKPKKLHRRLRQLGYQGNFKRISMTRWRNSASPLVSYALPNAELVKMGLFDMTTVQTGVLPHVA